jgi:hypothetical protein
MRIKRFGSVCDHIGKDCGQDDRSTVSHTIKDEEKTTGKELWEREGDGKGIQKVSSVSVNRKGFGFLDERKKSVRGREGDNFRMNRQMKDELNDIRGAGGEKPGGGR